jgi:chemotaxis protein methyltransferase WspC
MAIVSITQRIRTLAGLNLPEAAVAKAVDQRMQARGIRTQVEYAVQALRQPAEFDALVELLVVPETWFFRDGDAFQAAVRIARQRLEHYPGPVRILSLPCASGEEAYSLAIALLDAGIPQAGFHIEGVDINGKAIEQAKRADYRTNAFRSQDLAFRDRLFDAHAGGYRLHPEICKLVEFRKGNLFDPDAVQGLYDIVFCRNLLIYFDDTMQQAAIGRLKTLLTDDGVLFVGYAEAATLLRDDFELAPFPKAFAVRRRSKDRAEVQALPARAEKAKPVINRRRLAALPAPMLSALPAVPEADLLEQARELANRGLTEAAIKAYRDILAMHPACAEACFMLGLLCERRQDARAAEDYLRRAVYLDPNHYEALCHLALLAEGRGSPAIADALRQRAARVYRRRESMPCRNDRS